MIKVRVATRAQLSQDFLAGFYSRVGREEALAQMDPRLSESLGELSHQHSEDLLANLRVNFSWPTYQEISHQAGERLAEAWLEMRAAATPSKEISESDKTLDFQKKMSESSELRQLWHHVALDFHRNDFWGFPQQVEDAELPEDPEAQGQKEGLSYIWMALQSLILMKIIILVFGIRFSNDPSLMNGLVFTAVLTIAFGGLFFFAYRWRNRSS